MQPTFTWRTTAGKISASGLLTAPATSVSNGTVTASSGTLSGSAAFTVSAPKMRETGRPPFGLFDPKTSVFYLRNTNNSGYADATFAYGAAGTGWIPIAGDWDGNGTESMGLYNPATSTFYLRNTNDSGYADETFTFGPAGAGWIPIAGDWNGDGTVTIGLYNPATSTFYLRNTNDSGYADLTFEYGPANAGWLPIAGDWNGSGTDTIGLYNPTTSAFYLRNTNDSGYANRTFAYGPANAGWLPIAGDWNGSGTDTIGLYNPTTSVFYLRNTNSSGYANRTFAYGAANAGWMPVVSDGNGSAPALGAAVGAAVATPDTAPFNGSALLSLATEAIARGTAAGSSASALSALKNVSSPVADLPNSRLGLAETDAVDLARDAAGHGWFVDPTPALDEEFAASPSDRQSPAIDPRPWIGSIY